MIDWGYSLLRRDIAFSRRATTSESGEREKYPPVLLQEYLYGLPNAESLYHQAEEQLVERIRTFAESPGLAKLRFDGSRPDSVVEGRAQVKGLGCRVDGTIDLAFRADGEFRIIDWKLGEPERTGGESLQLGTYALSVVSEGRATVEDLHAGKVYLSTGEMVGFSVNSAVLARVRARIVQDAERMAVLHEHGVRGVEEAFTPCHQQRVCSACSFREVCPVGRQL
jgi:CRISPR/Cas system-associated exonuclease Cas4 (RecB family)